jgi:hypothetical protein
VAQLLAQKYTESKWKQGIAKELSSLDKISFLKVEISIIE